MATEPRRAVLVWDLPMRLFHWMLVALVIFSYTTAEIGGNLMAWHVRSGYAILALLLFRILWGICGSQTARFTRFVLRPRVVFEYARNFLHSPVQPHAGHNPLGGWMVMLMLGLLICQVVSGLFADDEIATTGPLAKHASAAIVRGMSQWHEINSNALIVLVTLHFAAILFYLILKKDNLVRPMLTGKKMLPADIAEPRKASDWLALACLAAGAMLVASVVWFA